MLVPHIANVIGEVACCFFFGSACFVVGFACLVKANLTFFENFMFFLFCTHTHIGGALVVLVPHIANVIGEVAFCFFFGFACFLIVVLLVL